MLGLAALAIDLLAGTVTRHRFAAGSYVNGLFVAGAETSSPIAATVQAPKREDLEQAPEGERIEGTVVIHTRSDLRTANEDAGTPADEVTVAAGERYKIVSVAARREAGFVRALARRTDDRGRGV